MQHRHEKLLQCFVGLTAKVSSSSLGAGNMIDPDMAYLTEPRMQFSAYSGNRFGGMGSLEKREEVELC